MAGSRSRALPDYQPVMGKLWLERGGTLRDRQHPGRRRVRHPLAHAGRREGKARAHDDFAAVAADLVPRAA